MEADPGLEAGQAVEAGPGQAELQNNPEVTSTTEEVVVDNQPEVVESGLHLDMQVELEDLAVPETTAEHTSEEVSGLQEDEAVEVQGGEQLQLGGGEVEQGGEVAEMMVGGAVELPAFEVGPGEFLAGEEVESVEGEVYLGPVPTEEPSQSYQQPQGELQLDQVLGDHTEEVEQREDDQEREAAALEQPGEQGPMGDSVGGLHDLPAMPRLVNQGEIGFSTAEAQEGFGDESDYDSDEDNFEPEENGEELYQEDELDAAKYGGPPPAKRPRSQEEEDSEVVLDLDSDEDTPAPAQQAPVRTLMSGRPGYPAMFERGGPPSLYPAAPQFSAVAPPPAPPRRTAAPATGICFKDGEVFWKPFAQLPDWLTNNNQAVSKPAFGLPVPQQTRPANPYQPGLQSANPYQPVNRPGSHLPGLPGVSVSSLQAGPRSPDSDGGDSVQDFSEEDEVVAGSDTDQSVENLARNPQPVT